MKKHSLLAAILALLVSAALLTGCGNGSGGTAESTEAPTSTPTETAQADDDPEETDVDDKGDEEEITAVNTTILKEADDMMINTYTVIAVNPEAPFTDADGNAVSDVAVNTAGAEALIKFLLSEEGKSIAADFGQEEFGDSLFYLLEDAPVYEGEIEKATEDTAAIRLSTTTSVNDSGLLGAVLPVFEETYGYKVEVQSAGTGQAIAAAQYGNADAILVHAKASEEEFVNGGFAYTIDGFDSERLSFLYNYFVLCGPSDDPAGVEDAKSVTDAFAAIAEGEHPFISRGDASGTHVKELSLWPESLGITEEADSFAVYTGWYTSANAGMGACLVMAEEMQAYILTDKATFLTFVSNGGVME